MTLLHRFIFAAFILCVVGGNADASIAANDDLDKPRIKLSLDQQAEQGRIDSKKLEQSQLDKARAAAQKTEEREQDILSNQEQNNWQDEQRKKAKSQFNDRAERENKYLKQAQEAAAKERQIVVDKATTKE